ncbi:MAG: ATP-binding protein [bacterium]|nr:ATP-binding protein [bacterium]
MMYQNPVRMFENSGVVNPEEAYYVTLDGVSNTKKQDIKTMVDRGRYFSIFAPRQSGKTTFFKRMCDQLHKDPVYVAIALSFQDSSSLNKSRFYELLEMEIYGQLLDRLQEVGCDKYGAVEEFLENHRLTDHTSFRMLFMKFNRIIRHKKIVIFIDEFDGIPLGELENFLTALRELYQKFKEVKQKALYSVGLVGIRNVAKLIVGGVSPFNIADEVEWPPFSLKNVRELYAQYTAETNQPFTEDAVKRVHEETAGQPWLVNRLGIILSVDIKPGTVEPIDEMDVKRAIKILLKERNDHFDNLYEKAKLYKETFVEIIFDNVEYHPYDEDQTWLEQYGLIKKFGDRAVVANNIYKAMNLKIFGNEARLAENVSTGEYLLPGGWLDMERILLDFEKYIALIGVNAFYEQQKPYEKTGQYLLTVWLYQFVKGGDGDVRYEVRTGLGRMDIFLTYKGRKYIIETKLNRRGNIAGLIADGVRQVAGKYMATEKEALGYLVIFDTQTPTGAQCKPQIYKGDDNKKVTGFIMGIGKSTPPLPPGTGISRFASDE